MSKPHNEIQQICYERYQYGLELLKRMEGKSAVELADRFGTDRKVIMRIREGTRPRNLTLWGKIKERDLETIRELNQEYRDLRDEYLAHYSAAAIARDLGIKKKTANTYGKGQFGVKPRRIRFVKPQPVCVDSDLALSFATMRLTRNPQSHTGYY